MLNGTMSTEPVLEDAVSPDDVQEEVLEGDEPSTPDAGNFVSRDELMKLLDEHSRRTQSLVDRTAGRFDKRLAEEMRKINDVVEMGQKIGVQYTPEQIFQLRQQAMDKAAQDEQNLSEPPPEAPEAPNVNPISLAANEMVRRAGIRFTAADPEINLINQRTTDPGEYLLSVDKAIKAYQRRVAPKSSAAAPAAHLRGSAPDSEEAMTAELEKLLNHPTPQNMPRIRELKNKLGSG